MASKAKHKSNPSAGSKKQNDSNLTSDDIKKFTTIENGTLTISSRIAHKIRHKGFAQAEALGINSYFKIMPDGEMILCQTFEKLDVVPIERYEIEKSRRAVATAEKVFSHDLEEEEEVVEEEGESPIDGEEEENLGFEKKILSQMKKTQMLKEIGINALKGIEEKKQARFFSLFDEYAKMHDCLAKESPLHEATKKWEEDDKMPFGMVNLLKGAKDAMHNIAGLLARSDLSDISAKEIKEIKERGIEKETYFFVKEMVNFKGKEVDFLKVFKDTFSETCKEEWVEVYAEYSVLKMLKDNPKMTAAVQNFEKEKITVSHVKPSYSGNFLDPKEIRKNEMNRGAQKGLLGLEKEIRELALGVYPKEMGNKFDLVGFKTYEDKLEELRTHFNKEGDEVKEEEETDPDPKEEGSGEKEKKKKEEWHQSLPIFSKEEIIRALQDRTHEEMIEVRKRYYEELERQFMFKDVDGTHVLRGSILGKIGSKNALLQSKILEQVNKDKVAYHLEMVSARKKVSSFIFEDRMKVKKEGENFYVDFEKEKDKKKEEKKKKEKNKFGKKSSSHHADAKTLEQKDAYRAICRKIVKDITIAAKKQVLEKVLQIENPFLREKTFEKIISLAGGYVAATEDENDNDW